MLIDLPYKLSSRLILSPFYTHIPFVHVTDRSFGIFAINMINGNPMKNTCKLPDATYPFFIRTSQQIRFSPFVLIQGNDFG